MITTVNLIPPTSDLAKIGLRVFHHKGQLDKSPQLNVTQETIRRTLGLPEFDGNAIAFVNARHLRLFQIPDALLPVTCHYCKRQVVTKGTLLVGHGRIESFHKACAYTQLYKKKTDNPKPQSSAIKPTVRIPLIRDV